MGEDGVSVLDVVRRRWPVFERLLEEPRHKRDLVAAVEESRSTVDRAVRELTAAGLVERADGGYVASVAGRLAAAKFRATRESLATIGAATAALAPLPHDAALSGTVLRDATVTVAGAEAAPADLVDRFLGGIDAAQRVDLLVGTAASEAFADTVDTAVADARIAGRRVRADDGAPDGGVADALDGDAPPVAVPPFSLLRTPLAVRVLVHDGDGGAHALVETEADVALEWAAGRFDTDDAAGDTLGGAGG
jgi:hypothetical protein